MFILEIMLAVFIGTVTYVICLSTHQKPLAAMTKMLTIFLCVEIAVKVVVPVFYSAKQTVDRVEKKVYSIEGKLDKVDKTIEKLPDFTKPDKNKGGWNEFLYDQLYGPEGGN